MFIPIHNTALYKLTHKKCTFFASSITNTAIYLLNFFVTSSICNIFSFLQRKSFSYPLKELKEIAVQTLLKMFITYFNRISTNCRQQLHPPVNGAQFPVPGRNEFCAERSTLLTCNYKLLPQTTPAAQ